MARYIDADALIENMRNRKYIDKALCEIFETVVDEQPTAYDVEAVVAELEKERKTAHRTYEMYQLRVDLGRIFGMEKAIEIVRGKERKYCGNCKHQPEPLTTCEWLKSQTQIIKECPRWEGKE